MLGLGDCAVDARVSEQNSQSWANASLVVPPLSLQSRLTRPSCPCSQCQAAAQSPCTLVSFLENCGSLDECKLFVTKPA